MIRWLFGGITAGALFISFVLLWMVAPEMEARLNPILTAQKVGVKRDGNRLTINFTAYKRRDCPMVDIDFQVHMVNAGLHSYQPIVIFNEEGPPVLPGLLRDYPPGKVFMGPLTATLPQYYLRADQIIGLALYRCHPLWTTPQVFGPVEIPDPAINE